MIKTKINSKDVAQKLGAYSHGYSVDIRDAKIIFTTGQIALDKDGKVNGNYIDIRIEVDLLK